MSSKLFGKKEQGIVGYIYVADSDEGIFKNATPGKIIKNKKKGPPWIVVDHGINTMIIAKWPGSLWRAEVIDEAKNTGLLDYAKYARANGVRILEKLPLDTLFGKYSSSILKVIAAASATDIKTVQKLSKHFPLKASELYSKGWNIFDGTQNDQSPHYGRNHLDTIEMPGDEGSSPINRGFSIIYSQVFDRANDLTDGRAILANDDGELYLNGEWSRACASYLCAAMAVAYQDKFSKNEIKILSEAWKVVYGDLSLKT